MTHMVVGQCTPLTGSAGLAREVNQLREQNAKLLAALQAQDEADKAGEAHVGYEAWQKLQDKAEALRRAILAN